MPCSPARRRKPFGKRCRLPLAAALLAALLAPRGSPAQEAASAVEVGDALAMQAAFGPSLVGGARLTSAASRVASHLRAGRQTEALRTWESAIRKEMSARRTPSEADVDALVLLVVRQAYLEPESELQERMDRARLFHDRERELRLVLDALRAEQEIAPDPARGAVIVRREQQLAAAIEDAEGARTDLRRSLLRYQRTLQAIFDASRTLHHTAMFLIRGGA